MLQEKMDLFKPSKYLSFSVHLDGPKEEHDFSVCKEGGYELAIEGVKEAVKRGFRVTTNTTLFDGFNPKHVRKFFDDMMALGVEGMMLSPGYSYDKAPDRQHCLGRGRIVWRTAGMKLRRCTTTSRRGAGLWIRRRRTCSGGIRTPKR